MTLLLQHDRLLAIGGPKHGELLPIVRGADVLLVAEPTLIDVTSLTDEHETFMPGSMQTVSYRRTRIVFDGYDAAGHIIVTLAPPTVEVLLCAGYRLGYSGYRELVERLGIGLMLALCGGAVWRNDFAITWYRYQVDDGVRRHEYAVAVAREQGHAIPDTWSQADEADRCWRCDATSSTTDVGLCDNCLDDLREDAA